MIFYYALGGGLGHITRAQALIHTLGLEAPVTLAMTSTWPRGLLPIPDQFRQVRAPRALSRDARGVREWINEILSSEHYQLIIIDAFPAGLLGELCDFPFPATAKLLHCARRLRWPVYAQYLTGQIPQYHRCYQLEQLSTPHLDALSSSCQVLETLKLEDRTLSDGPVKRSGDSASRAPLWLIIHAGSDDETMELVEFATESAAFEGVTPRFLLISPQRPEALSGTFEHRCEYPAHHWFSHADRIFSACGFNTARQLSAHRAKHRFIPFSRRFDDQFARAAALRSGEWDQFASMSGPLNNAMKVRNTHSLRNMN